MDTKRLPKWATPAALLFCAGWLFGSGQFLLALVLIGIGYTSALEFIDAKA